MDYFEINRSDDLKEIGHYPQTDFQPGYNPNLANSHWQVQPHEFPDFVPNYELALHPKAKRSNYIDHVSGGSGFLIDKTFKNLLDDFILPPHHFYKIKVYHKEELLDYYWFHFIAKDFWDYIDTQKSTAIIKHIANPKNVREVAVESRQQLMDIKKELNFEYQLKFQKLVFTSDFPRYDVYETMGPQFIPMISDRLLQTLKEAGMTGFQTKPIEFISIDV